MSNKHSSKKQNKSLDIRGLVNKYKWKKVAVAGGAGFVGIQLVRLLADLGAEVLVLDNFSRGTNIVSSGQNVSYAFQAGAGSYHAYELKSGEEALRYASILWTGVDVGDWKYYVYLLEDVDYFFNLTAVVAGVLYNQNHHMQMYSDNARVLAGPLLACEQAGVPAFLQTSSVCVYAEDHQSPCDDSIGWGGDPHPANAGYAEAKRDGERMAQWANIDKVVIVRPSNIVGPYDYYDDKAHVIPDFIHRAITTTGDFVAYGSAVTQREFIYSVDVAIGMAWALAFGDGGEVYNLGANGDNTITMNSLAHKIIDIYHSMLPEHAIPTEQRRVIFDNTRGGGDLKRYSNSEKLRGLGWTHVVDLNDALGWTIREYMFRGGWKDDISMYMDMYGLTSNSG